MARDAVLSVARASASLLGLRLAPPDLAYVGWVGKGNAGDDAVFRAHQHHLGPLRLRPVLTDHPRLSSWAAALPGAGVPLLLGGGTVVGRPDWRARLAPLRPHDAGLWVVGAGVEDPRFEGRRRYTDDDELRRWADLLHGAEHVSVRGPRSQELLAGVGVDAAVVGDPALLLGAPAGTPDGATIAVAAAAPEDAWPGSTAAVHADLGRLCKELVSEGWHLVLLALDHADERVARSLARQAGAHDVVVYDGDLSPVLHGIARSTVVVAHRLHGAVLAAAVGRPFVALSYRPKVDDLVEALGVPELAVATAAGVRPGVIREVLDAVLGDVDAVAERIRAGVEPLRRASTEAWSDMRHRVVGGG